jgi:hypothetical protein
MKSSLKTFLAGQNPYYVNVNGPHLEGSTNIADLAPNFFTEWYTYLWFTDLLDDGTAITYCCNEDK